MCDLCTHAVTRRSFVTGSAGAAAAFALSPGLLRGLVHGEGHRTTARPHLQIALEAWNWLDAHRIDTGTGATWPADPTDPESTGYTLYTHSPGVLPFALELHHATGDQQYLDAAVAGAAHLAATLDQVQGAGLYTGLAGIAFVLTETWRATGRESHQIDAGVATARLLDQASQAGSGIAWPQGSGSGYRVFHSRPGGDELYYLSWCHGPVGTNRLFHQIAQITGDGEWRDWVTQGARAVMATGIPEQRTPGFWENISQCCGTAGVAEHCLTLYRTTGDADYKTFVDRLNTDLLARSSSADPPAGGDGRQWTQAEHRVQPELLVAQTGHMQGAAGVGKYLLHMDAMEERGEGPRVVLPDDPW